MKPYLLLFMFVSILPLCSFGQSKDELAIRSLLNKQTEAWNNGNIDGFMQGYLPTDSLMFIGKSGITYGYNNTMANYKKNYADTAAMGKLAFDFVKMEKLSSTHYFVVGKWFLTRSIGNIGGHFTLILKKIKKEWLIVADHSS